MLEDIYQKEENSIVKETIFGTVEKVEIEKFSVDDLL